MNKKLSFLLLIGISKNIEIKIIFKNTFFTMPKNTLYAKDALYYFVNKEHAVYSYSLKTLSSLVSQTPRSSFLCLGVAFLYTSPSFSQTNCPNP